MAIYAAAFPRRCAVYFGRESGTMKIQNPIEWKAHGGSARRSLLLRRAGGSGVAARLLVEDTTSVQPGMARKGMAAARMAGTGAGGAPGW